MWSVPRGLSSPRPMPSACSTRWTRSCSTSLKRPESPDRRARAAHRARQARPEETLRPQPRDRRADHDRRQTRQRRRARPPPGTSQAGAAVGAESPPPARCLTHPPHSPVAEGGAWSTRSATTTTGPLLEYARGIRRRPRILITGASRRRSCRITLGGAEHDDHHQCGYFFQRRHRARPSFPGRPFSLCDRSRAARTDRAITSLRCRRKPVGGRIPCLVIR